MARIRTHSKSPKGITRGKATAKSQGSKTVGKSTGKFKLAAAAAKAAIAKPTKTKAAGGTQFALGASATKINGAKGTPNSQWVAENRERYLGQWVALDNGKLVANGKDAVKVYDTARGKGVEIPFIHLVTEQEPLNSMGGWL
jgi:hypothetical protein